MTAGAAVLLMCALTANAANLRTAASIFTCGEGWTLYHPVGSGSAQAGATGHCYRTITKANTWDEAKRNCAMMGDPVHPDTRTDQVTGAPFPYHDYTNGTNVGAYIAA